MNRYVLIGILGMIALNLQSISLAILGDHFGVRVVFIASGLFLGLAGGAWRDK